MSKSLTFLGVKARKVCRKLITNILFDEISCHMPEVWEVFRQIGGFLPEVKGVHKKT